MSDDPAVLTSETKSDDVPEAEAVPEEDTKALEDEIIGETVNAIVVETKRNSSEISTIAVGTLEDESKTKTIPKRDSKVLGDEMIGETVDDIVAETKRIKKQNFIMDRMEHQSCKNFTIYLVFLILFFTGTYLARGDKTAFYVQQILKDDILKSQWDRPAGGAKNFYDIVNTHDIYDLLTSSLVPTFYGENADNGDVLANDYRYYYTTSKMLGMRIRQLRVNKGGCDIPDEYKAYIIRDCYPEFSPDTEQTSTFTGTATNNTYAWSSAEDTGEASMRAKLNDYPGSGYTVDLANNLTRALEQVAELKADNWIAEPTRGVMIEFQAYNEAADLFISARVLIEIPASGGFRPKALIKAVKIPKFHSSREIALLVVDGLVLAFVLYFLFEELFEMRTLGCAYFESVWNWIDIVNITFFLISFACRGAFFLSFSGVNPVESYPKYTSLSGSAQINVVENVFSAINAFLLWIKLFKYWQRNKRVMFLIRTVHAAQSELLYFMFIYLLFLLSFMHAGYLAFSTQVADFRSLSISFVTVFASLAGGSSSPMGRMHEELLTEHSSITEANRLYGYIFFMSFNVIVLVILTNLFLAILNKSYIVTREKLKREEAVMRVRNARAEEILALEKKQRKPKLFHLPSLSLRRNSKSKKEEVLETKKLQVVALKANTEDADAAVKIQALWRGKVARDLVLDIQIHNQANQKAVDAQVKKLTGMAYQLVAKINVQKRKLKEKKE